MAACLCIKHKGNTQAAQEEFALIYEDVLLPGQQLPSRRFFKRQAEKFLEYNTVEDLVCILLLTIIYTRVHNVCPGHIKNSRKLLC